jgi:hypothetical protein
MKHLIAAALLLLPLTVFAQNQSSTRDFIDKASTLQINKDWTITAEFYSGLGEYVKFYPVEVMDLKSRETRDALQLEMHTKAGAEWVDAEAWVGLDEVAGLINFVESYVIPNLDLNLSKKSREFIFESKEMKLSFMVNERKRRISIWLNNYGNDKGSKYYFWTESQINNINYLLMVLKRIK